MTAHSKLVKQHLTKAIVTVTDASAARLDLFSHDVRHLPFNEYAAGDVKSGGIDMILHPNCFIFKQIVVLPALLQNKPCLRYVL